jgi:hypothetical protein
LLKLERQMMSDIKQRRVGKTYVANDVGEVLKKYARRHAELGALSVISLFFSAVLLIDNVLLLY